MRRCGCPSSAVFLEQIEIENLTASALDLRLLFYHDFCLNESEIGDTAFFSPHANALVHYKRGTYLLINGRTEREDQAEGIFQYTTCRQRDTQRSHDWTTSLLRYAVAQDPAMADVVHGWLATWQPRAHTAVAGLAPLFGEAPHPLEPALVVTAADTAVRTVAEPVGP